MSRSELQDTSSAGSSSRLTTTLPEFDRSGSLLLELSAFSCQASAGMSTVEPVSFGVRPGYGFARTTVDTPPVPRLRIADVPDGAVVSTTQ